MGKRNVSMMYFLCSVVWFGLAVYFMLIFDDFGVGATFFCMGSLWIFVGNFEWLQCKRGNTTLDYYDQNAKFFVERSKSIDVSEQRNAFTSCIPYGGTILDWGCGSGRDTIEFLKEGYRVEATDGSREICRLATDRTGIEVRCERFESLNEKEAYDGIWACASILHLEKEKLAAAMRNAVSALKPGGVMYVCFKAGSFEGVRKELYYVDMNDELFSQICGELKDIQVLKKWLSEDSREERHDEKWYNVLIKKERKRW